MEVREKGDTIEWKKKRCGKWKRKGSGGGEDGKGEEEMGRERAAPIRRR